MSLTEFQYREADRLANAIEEELKQIGRWSDEPLPMEAYENMGAFGGNTMAFEQWIQFILLERIRDIVTQQGDFPTQSSLGAYAVRVFDGDPQSTTLHRLLITLDELINSIHQTPIESENTHSTVTLGDDKLPDVVYDLIEVLHLYEGEDLESQLQTYDIFLSNGSPAIRPEVAALLLKAASRTANETSRKRIEEAAHSVQQGGRAAAPYNHEEAMRKHRQEHKKNFPELDL
jgi:uncharacterized protein YqcC (DUF446 family)